MGTATLTKRESQIAELIAWGGAKKEIADQLFISERTVENTARSIYDKTGVSKSTELSAWWFCTNFQISFALSPLKRQFMAIALLLLVVSVDLLSSPMVRIPRARQGTKLSASRARRNDSGADYLTEI